MIAIIRPDAWNLPLFLHVLGATLLFGALGAVTLLSVVGLLRPARVGLARGSLGTLISVALPSWAMMIGSGFWLRSKEQVPTSTHWVKVPVWITWAGLPLLILATGIALTWTRRPNGLRQPQALTTLSVVFMLALGVAWWVMTAKPVL